MSKDWRVRITETIEFIRNATVPVHGEERRPIAEQLKDRYDRHVIPQATSERMSQGKYKGSGSQKAKERETRKYRRAVILIQAVLLGKNAATAANEVAMVSDLFLPQKLGAVLYTVGKNKRDDLWETYRGFLRNPGTFMAQNKIHTVGAATSGATPHTFFYNPEKYRYEFAKATSESGWTNTTGTWEVCIRPTVYNVHVQKYSAVKDHLDQIAGSVVAGANLMITTQLSGCSLIFETQGSQLTAAHIQPTGVDASQMTTNLRQNGGFENPIEGAACHVFGRQALKTGSYDYTMPPHTYIMGIFKGGQWELYAQQFDAMARTAATPTMWRVNA